MKRHLLFLLALLFLLPLFSTGQENKEDDDEEDDVEITTDTIVPIDYSHLFNPVNGKAVFVCDGIGNDQFEGTQLRPVKTIVKALELSNPNDVIIVAEGNYLTEAGNITISKAVKIYGSFDESFKERNIVFYPSLLSPPRSSQNPAEPLVVFNNVIEGTIIDGFIFDSSNRNVYSNTQGLYNNTTNGMMITSESAPKETSSSPEVPLVHFTSSTKNGAIVIKNNVFINGGGGGLKIEHSGGRIIVKNNVFAANRTTAIEIIPTCDKKNNPKLESSCFDCYINFNTILFTWGDTEANIQSGTGLKIYGNINYFITNNIFGANSMCGIDNSNPHNIDLLRFDINAFFCNKKGDMHFLTEKNKKVFYSTHQFEDIPFRSVFSNIHEVADALKIDKDYMNGFINAVFIDDEDFEPNSHPNIWRESVGQEKILKKAKKIKMYANKYPADKASILFGNDPDRGAQVFW